MATGTFVDIIAWQKAHSFTLSVYNITKSFPKEDLFGLTSQFRRAAVSIEANIAEGYRRMGAKDKLHFFNIAQGSLEECRCYIILSRDLSYCTDDIASELTSIIEETSRYLNSYSKAVVKNNGINKTDRQTDN